MSIEIWEYSSIVPGRFINKDGHHKKILYTYNLILAHVFFQVDYEYEKSHVIIHKFMKSGV